MSYKDNIAQVKIPPYSKKQELFNGMSHALGLFLAIAVLVFSFVLLSFFPLFLSF